jgi:hypothetical protein
MTATSTPAGEYLAAANRAVSAANGIDYDARHFRGDQPVANGA